MEASKCSAIIVLKVIVIDYVGIATRKEENEGAFV